MPKIKIDILEGKSDEYKGQLLNIVHESLVEAIKIPDYDRIQILNEYKSSNFEIPPGKSKNYTSIEIIMFPGRSLEAKRRLYDLITKNLKTSLRIEEKDVMIILLEPPLQNWGIVGKPATDIDLGFKTDV